jgi:hypothetical protein
MASKSNVNGKITRLGDFVKGGIWNAHDLLHRSTCSFTW